MSEAFVAVVVTVPEEHFPDDDDICRTAARFVCAKLATHLVHHGHLIPDWIQRGCDEDWGVYLESTTDDASFQYHICFFPGPADASQNQMLIQYNRQPHRANLLPEHAIHRTMQSFGSLFSGSRMLTKSQFEAEY